jgi:hypothetical protein
VVQIHYRPPLEDKKQKEKGKEQFAVFFLPFAVCFSEGVVV